MRRELLIGGVIALGACGGAAHPGGPAPTGAREIVIVDNSGHRAHGRGLKVPPGHYPPPGQCRVWYVDRPAGHQPRAARCELLIGQVPRGAFLLYNGKAWDTLHDWRGEERRSHGSVPVVVLRIMNSVEPARAENGRDSGRSRSDRSRYSEKASDDQKPRDSDKAKDADQSKAPEKTEKSSVAKVFDRWESGKSKDSDSKVAVKSDDQDKSGDSQKSDDSDKAKESEKAKDSDKSGDSDKSKDSEKSKDSDKSKASKESNGNSKSKACEKSKGSKESQKCNDSKDSKDNK